ncbi:hypothetical protein [Olivibacter sitiensis]|uniref:hypothetical protein n=1 Tax=Olivibacter sitiensis TaxID=376470 RepID=UPI00041E8BEF|nr:hypothetical protein [Olivibacter sitiensis]
MNGNSFFVFVFVLLTLGACSSRRVLQRDEPKKQPVEKPKEPTEEEVEKEEPAVRAPETIALLMPFQLDKVRGGAPSMQDADRAALALDFYQGFRLALDDLSDKGAYFRLNVLDSRDNAQQVSRLAQSGEVRDAKLIVGPVFPSELKSFNSAISPSSNILQVSPLAASVPDLAHVERVVTVTPTLEMHAEWISQQLAASLKPGDQVFCYDLGDADSEKFLYPIKYALQAKGIATDNISDLDGLELNMRVSGKSFVLCGSTNPFAISPLLAKLAELKVERSYDIVLIGHPNWAKLSDLDHTYLSQLQTTISTSFYVDERASNARKFSAIYEKQFGIRASEYAYKGYDTGRYFGELLNRHSQDDLTTHILDEESQGISTGFRFRFLEGQGYVNTSIQLLRFVGSEFKLLKGKM